MYFHEHHGERIAKEMGVDRRARSRPSTSTASGPRFGLTEPVDAFTYRELQERRELIRKRLEQHQRGRRRWRR